VQASRIEDKVENQNPRNPRPSLQNIYNLVVQTHQRLQISS